MSAKLNNNKSHFYQLRWWRENPERWRWGATIAIVFLMTGLFSYQNPQIWQNMQTEQSNIASEQSSPSTQTSPQNNINTSDDSQTGNNVTANQQQTTSTTDTANTTDTNDTTTAEASAPEFWQPPALGEWSRYYGFAYDQTYDDYRLHDGCDMELDVGALVYASAAGTVTTTATDDLWGGIIIISHGGGWKSVYKCVTPTIAKDDKVIAGQEIGTVMSSPKAESSQPSHLHFQLLLNDEPQNPQLWL